jgi:RNA polymerase sigma-54 factor
MLKPTLQLRLSQQLTMTPQLQQAIRLLQLPVMELQTQILDALEQNIMLEVEEPAAGETTEATESTESAAESDDDRGSDGEERELDTGETIDNSDWDEVQRTGPADTPRSNDPNLTFEQADRSEDTLWDHLLWQLELENLDTRTTTIGQAIIDAINEDGYVNEDLAEIQATLAPDVEASIEEIEQVLGLIQNFDPVGVGARSVSECVLLQLNQLDAGTPGLELARQIAREHLGLVAEHQYAQLRRILQSSEDDMNEALVLVRACHPRPGAAIHAPAAEYVVPDVFVRKVDGHWIVELNSSLAPRLKVNDLYAGSLGRGGEYDALKVQLQEARWLIRSLEIRNETLLKVAQTIVQRQTDFLEHGEEHMRPMVLRDIAEAIEMHESTVSRVTTNKYMHTPRGIVEFRFFFSSHVAGDDGDQSSIAVRAKIRKLIGGENPAKPMSDNQIARLLSEDGVQVARRTVAKYREAMDIPSSSERKKSRLAG